MLLKSLTLFTSFTFLILGYLLYKPLPEQVEEPWIYRTQGVIADLLGIMVGLLLFVFFCCFLFIN